MKKQIYLVSAYIPNDENIVYTSTYKLQSLGMENIIYVWVNIEDVGGIGTGIDDYGSSSVEDAFIKIHPYIEKDGLSKFIKTSNFNEMLEIRKEFIESLTKQLKPIN